MGQNQPLELSEEEKKELSIGLLREWWIAATQALVDTVGTSTAMGLLIPGFRHHGRSAYHILARSLGMKEEEIGTIASVECLAKTIMSGSPAQVELREDGVIWTIERCMTAGQCKEACLSYCYHSGIGMVEESFQGMEYLLHESISQGDLRCLASIGKRGKGLPTGKLIQAYSPASVGLSKQEWDFWGRAGIGENWAIVTRAAVEVLGKDNVMAMFKPYMHQSGISLGLRMEWNIGGVTAQEKALKAIAMVQGCLGMEGRDEMSGSFSGEISTCPFSGAPVEICEQFEVFLGGLCEALDSDLKFSYDRMMTKGDKTCHWTIRKKGEAAKEKVKEEAPDDPIKMLTTMYIKDEITEEELEKKIAHLRKLGLVR
jgi:hypothetical protein